MKAIALISGGLDSTLAVKLIRQQDVEVIVLNFRSPFCCCSNKGCGFIREDLGCEFKHIPLQEEFLEIVKNPKHGYGSNLNPCIDCRILMLRKSKDLMHELGASFIVTGEVLGQRPMSQHRRALNIIEKEAGLEGLVLRPLSAKLFPSTIPEQKGWVDRERLLSFSGRSRKPQISLAKDLSIKDYPCSAGGCLLTDPMFSRRVKDLFKHNSFNLEEVNLLKIGRHFRLDDRLKLITGRDEQENKILDAWVKKSNPYLVPDDFKGPIGILRGAFSHNAKLDLAASIIAYYSDSKRTNLKVNIRFIQPQAGQSRIIQTLPLDSVLLEAMRL